MARRRVIRVLPAKAWRVEGKSRDTLRDSFAMTFDSKSEAVAFARDEARRQLPSQVVVHGDDGQIQKEWTYGADPRRRRG